MKRKKHHRQHMAWAIERTSVEGPKFLIGRYWFGARPYPEHNGSVVALFRTRKDARARIADETAMRIVRVRVTIEEVN